MMCRNRRTSFGTALLGLFLLMPSRILAGDADLTIWQNLQHLKNGQEIEVKKADGAVMRGAFLSLADESIYLRHQQQEMAIARKDVSSVRARPTKNRRNIWVGAAIGAAAGAGVGAGLGEQLANESGGDLRNLKPAIIGVCAGVGALTGALVGSAVGGRFVTIYKL